MSANVIPLEGTEWQKWADQLLTEHYGPTSYVKIPDTQGDGGIEGFSRPCGHAYQAYGADKTKSGKALYEAQRDKMTRDINKFITNKNLLAKLLGDVKISKWVLLVPTVGLKDLQSHANKMTQLVRDAKLPYVTDDFYVTYCDEDSFAKERDKITSYMQDSIAILAPSPDSSAVDEWHSENDALMQTLKEKIERLEANATPQRVAKLQRQMLQWHLHGRSLLSKLNELSPSTYERVFEAKTQYEQSLVAHELIAANARQQLREVMEGFEKAVREAGRSLTNPNTRSLVCEAIADWMMRCPLDFPE
ncbi:hypothetical protein [Crateriforma spongiae]|uniref:hypothetical protein n=1 Tax=Crateriforma spongiae TaxID=2724528 RepID=UPI0039AF3D72